jgi:hypothetical protein
MYLSERVEVGEEHAGGVGGEEDADVPGAVPVRPSQRAPHVAEQRVARPAGQRRRPRHARPHAQLVAPRRRTPATYRGEGEVSYACRLHRLQRGI